jgi:cell migration-inducing and hyaluronan-binding protein
MQSDTLNWKSCTVTRLASAIRGALAGVVLALVASTVWAQSYAPVRCNEQQRQPFPTQTSAGNPQDLLVTGTCDVPVGNTYYFRNVNIVYGGALVFNEPRSVRDSQTHFWAASIIVEASGSLFAYAMEGGQETQPFGYHGGTLTFHLYGSDESKWDPQNDKFVAQNQGALCRSEHTGLPCGIPDGAWESNGSTLQNLSGLPDNVKDYFYQYGPLRGDAKCDDGTIWTNGYCGTKSGKVGYFGNKVLAVSYRGNLGLYGYKGATYDHHDSNFPLNDNLDPTSSGASWIRLQNGKSLEEGANELWLERAPQTWSIGDKIVVTTTDYLPGHSEMLKITEIDGAHMTFEAIDGDNTTKKIRWRHNGVRYGGPADQAEKRWTNGSGQPGRLIERLWRSVSGDLRTNGAETTPRPDQQVRLQRIDNGDSSLGRNFLSEAVSTVTKLASQLSTPYADLVCERLKNGIAQGALAR